MTERRDVKRDAAGRLATGTPAPPRVVAARSMLEAAGYTVTEVDPFTWRIGAYLYRPASELWTGGPGAQGYGTRTLIDRMRAAPEFPSEVKKGP